MPAINLANGHVFKYVIQGDKIPEVYGWVEHSGGGLVKGESGFYRTDDPMKAAKIAACNIGTEVIEE